MSQSQEEFQQQYELQPIVVRYDPEKGLAIFHTISRNGLVKLTKAFNNSKGELVIADYRYVTQENLLRACKANKDLVLHWHTMIKGTFLKEWIARNWKRFSITLAAIQQHGEAINKQAKKEQQP